jgi:hypothetical protein
VVACYDEFERNVITPGLLDRFRFKPGYMFFLQLQKWLVLALPAKSLAVFDLSEYYYPEHNNAARLNYAFQVRPGMFFGFFSLSVLGVGFGIF